MLKAIVFDFGHTIMREDSCIDPHLQDCPIDLMPGAREAIEMIRLPKGIWANTLVATAADIRTWLGRAGLDHQISWVAASFELGCRKPEPEFFTRALAACDLQPADTLFVGNQLDTDIVGANRVGIPCVYLAAKCYRSLDEHVTPEAKPTFTIETLFELPGLITNLRCRLETQSLVTQLGE
jgi:FMN phosphatase YigB (HAD superfamily)